MDDLIERLQAGCVYRPKRWSGDTHDDLGGPIDEAATESLLAEAAAALSQQRAVPEVTDEMVEIVGKQLWRYWGDVKGAAARTYRNKTRKALEDALAAAPAYTKSRVRTYRATDGRNC